MQLTELAARVSEDLRVRNYFLCAPAYENHSITRIEQAQLHKWQSESRIPSLDSGNSQVSSLSNSSVPLYLVLGT